MRIVFLNQYYPPDAAPTGVMLEAVVEHLAAEGHEVTVLCAAGGYAGGGNIEHRTSNIERRIEERGDKELSVVGGQLSVEETRVKGDNIEHRTSNVERRRGEGEVIFEHRTSNIERRSEEAGPVVASGVERGIHSALPSSHQPSTLNCLRLSPLRFDSQPSTLTPRIIRLPASRFGRGTFVGKLLDYASYYLGAAWKLLTLRPAPDRIVALTTPPYLSVLARLVSKVRGADHAHWVMDLYPDVMVAHGMLAEGGWKHRLLAGMARWGFGGRRCAAVLTLGPGHGGEGGRIVECGMRNAEWGKREH